MKTKVKVANLKKVNFALVRKETIRIVNEMKSKEIPGGDSPETAIPFFVKKNHTFSCGTEHPLLVLAAKNPAWKKQAKEAFKEDKKGMFYGSCYIMEDSLFLKVQKGNMKMIDLKKGAKMLLKKAGVANVGLCQGGVKQEETSSTTSEEATTSMASTQQDPKTQDPEQRKQQAKKEAQKAKGRETMDKMFANLQKWAKALRIS
ncbi:MAG: hypothetical protein MK212_13460 [Saprospiraceae bacterium]|nr:hypothetical protein [Saprospiraceae bacterium]